MKKRLIILVSAIVIIIAIVVTAIILWPKTFALSDQYYGKSEFTEVSVDELRNLIDNKQSFALFIYQPACVSSEDFEKILVEFSEQNQIGFVKAPYSAIRQSGLVEGLRYYPSAALYHDGELVTYLRTNRDEDLAAYQSLSGFTDWWRQYVKIK